MRFAAQTLWRPDGDFVRRATRDRAGLSFLEGLVVLAILALVAAFGISSLRQPAVAAASPTGAQEISDVLREARNLSASAHLETRVYIDLEHRQVTTSWRSDVVALPGDAELSVTFDRTGPVRHAIASFVFQPDGSATGGSIRLEGDRLRQVISVDWLTGTILRTTQPL